MCRGSQYDNSIDGLYRHRLRIKSLMLELELELSLSGSGSQSISLPNSLTLVFLPRINGSPLEVNGSKIRADTPAFVSLHRVLLTHESEGVIFAARDRVRGCDGLSFEVHVGQHRFLTGIFRQSQNDDFDNIDHIGRRRRQVSLLQLNRSKWMMECKCVLGSSTSSSSATETQLVSHITEAELSVSIEEGGEHVMKQKVAVPSPRNRPIRRRCRNRGSGRGRAFETHLQGIPEERDEDYFDDDNDNASCSCNCSCDIDIGSSNDSKVVEPSEMEMKMEEGLQWAVDVGFWAVCFGVGLLLTRASANTLSRTNFLLPKLL